MSVLTLRAGDRHCAVPLVHVAEVMRPLPIEPLAGAPPFVRGLAIVRGSATPVIDLAALLNEEASTAPGDTARFVALRVGERGIVLHVSAVLAIRALASAELEALPALWRGPHPPAVVALAARDRELLMVLEAARLLPDDSIHVVTTDAA